MPCSRLELSPSLALTRACHSPVPVPLEPLALRVQSESADQGIASRAPSDGAWRVTMSLTLALSEGLVALEVAGHPSTMLLLCLRTTAKSSRPRDLAHLKVTRAIWDRLSGQRLPSSSDQAHLVRDLPRPCPLAPLLPLMLFATVVDTATLEDNHLLSSLMHRESLLSLRLPRSSILDSICAPANLALIPAASVPILIPA